MRPTTTLTLAAVFVVGVAMILREVSRRQRRPSAISRTLEHEDYVPEYIASGEDAMLDDRVAPGAPL
jgi:hypothetical protein